MRNFVRCKTCPKLLSRSSIKNHCKKMHSVFFRDSYPKERYIEIDDTTEWEATSYIGLRWKRGRVFKAIFYQT
jgi:phage FluMu protein Com